VRSEVIPRHAIGASAESVIPVFASTEGAVEVDRAYRRVLDAWPVPAVQREVTTRFGSTAVIESGPKDGAPVVLLHAYFATSASWYRIADRFGPGVRTFAVDVIGDANRSRPTQPLGSLDDYVAWYRDVLEGLGIEKHAVVGNSFGGFLATLFAMRLPERVGRLVVIGPAATFHPMPAFYAHMFVPKATYLFLPWLPGRDSIMRTAARWMRAGLPRDRLWDPLFESVLRHGSTANRVWPRVFRADELRAITAPALLLLGDRERIYRPEAAALSASERLPGIEVRVVPRAHHVTAIAQPEAVGEEIRRFLAHG
jgi:pimeloyl-ACP methyl ester carboxylesterase